MGIAPSAQKPTGATTPAVVRYERMTNSEPKTRKDLPHGHTPIGVDAAGREHRYAGGVKDDRVFVLDGDAVVAVVDLGELAAAGKLSGTQWGRQYYAADTPRAWIAAIDEWTTLAKGYRRPVSEVAPK